MDCPKCGSENKDDAPYCWLCLERFGPAPPPPADRPGAAVPVDDTQGRRTRTLIVVLGVLLVIAVAVVAVASSGGYSVSRYEVLFDPRPAPGMAAGDLATEMRITYDVGLVPKFGGFKFVGFEPVDDVSVTDADGRPLTFTVNDTDYRETRIAWDFPPVMLGKRTVVVRFHVSTRPVGAATPALFAAEWPRNFSVPVHDVTFRYVLPPGVRPDSVTTSPEGGRVENGPAGPDRLHPKADPVVPRLAQLCQVRLGDGPRVRFQGQLGPGLQVEDPPDRIQDLAVSRSRQ